MFYVSSSIYEGFSNSLIEALALGLPIVSTDHDFGADEMIEDGVSGILVPTADPEAMAGGLERVFKRSEICRNSFPQCAEKGAEFHN